MTDRNQGTPRTVIVGGLKAGWSKRCEICGKERPYGAISVNTYEIAFYMKRNLKYCNDDPECTRLAAEKAARKEL